jgi:sigma-B regulation protein RsbU (phosphoserine phosphatase)
MIASESDSAMFVTIFYGVLDTATGELEYSLGGHNPPYIIYKDAGIEPLEMTAGMAVGVIEGIEYSSKKMSLKPGDTIFLYTDGVTEAMDGNGNMLGEARTESILKELKSSDLTNLIRGTISEVKNFSAGVPQSDDITVLAMRYLGR